MAKHPKAEIATEEYNVRIWRSKPDAYSITVSKDEGGEREVIRKVVPTVERAVEIASNFINDVPRIKLEGKIGGFQNG